MKRKINNSKNINLLEKSFFPKIYLLKTKVA